MEESIYDKVFNLCIKMGEGTKTKGYKHINMKCVKPNYINKIVDNVEQINELYLTLYNSELPQIQRTKSGGVAKHNIHHSAGAYDIQEIRTSKGVFKGIKISVLIKGYYFIFNCGLFTPNNSELSGKKAFLKFKKLCEKNNIDLTNYYIDNGKEIKETIPSSIIKFDNKYWWKKIQHVNHIDLNSAWSMGVIEKYPEFKPVFNKLKSEDKLLPSLALGYCQSEYLDYKLAHFSKEGIVWCNKKVIELMTKLELNDFEVIGINTDGLWYIDKLNKNRIYTDEDEGKEIGQYKTDHIDCEICAYSNGQYWFKEKGVFNVRARGFYIYEQFKPREQWDEYDFDKAMSSQADIKFIKGRGFVIHYV